jgi:hypothetical protein
VLFSNDFSINQTNIITMSLIAASINLTFNAFSNGCHRICWRPQGAPTYDCTTQVTCAGNGGPCTAVIGIQVDDAACVPQVFEGYAQACCEVQGSPNGQLPFTVTYNPNPNCKGYTITCTGPVSVAKVLVSNPGSGYAPPGGSIPVLFTPALGGVAANAIIGNGGVSSALYSAYPSPFGSGYVDGVYPNVPAVTLTGTGSGAAFKVVVSGGQVISTDIVVGANGIGYNPGDTVTFNNANLGGSGAGVVVNIVNINTGQIQNVVLVNPGSGYTAVAVATLPPPSLGPGEQAIIGAKMQSCPPADISTCFQGPAVTINLPIGVSFISCNSSPYVLNPAYTVSQNTCCNSCKQITFTKANLYDPPAQVFYEDCTTKELIKVILTGGGVVGPVCAVTGSAFVIESDPVNGSTSVVVGPSCP